MRRYSYLLMALLAFTGIACPPAPRVPNKKDNVNVSVRPAPIEDLPDHLKDRLDAALEHVRSRDLRTDNSFWTVFHGILGTGLEKTMLRDIRTDKKINAIQYICDGGEIRGLQFLPAKDGLDVQTGPMFEGQGHQDQFIAEMAQWGMKRDRKFRVGGKDYTFEDFTNHSKMRARVTQKQELSWAIIIIGEYYGTNITWTNSADETLRFTDVVQYELDQSIDMAACGGTHRLFGFTWAYYLHLRNGGKNEGVWKAAESKIRSYKQLAHDLQNKDGSFSTDYFKGPGKKQDAQLRISTTGHTLEWLALAMTDEELQLPWVKDAVNALVMMILNMRDEGIESGALYHAAHGLHLYRERVFGTPPAFLPLPPKR